MKVLLIDGYSDEPGGLGVPPYLDVYPRYIYGAIKAAHPSASIRYLTIDQARGLRDRLAERPSRYDVLIISAGVTVPGRYLSGRPLSASDLKWLVLIPSRIRVLAGPVAKYGLSVGGGRRIIPTKYFEELFDLVVTGDPELVINDLFRENLRVDRVNPRRVRLGYGDIEEFILRGTEVVLQHPNFGFNLVVEVETYRGCPRAISGGCSFCSEVLWGLPRFREQENIVREVEALYKLGVRNIRLGRQPDIFAYKAEGVGEAEFPRPRPDEVLRLFRGISNVAPGLETLHIDNVNPGTVYHHVEESIKVAKIIIQFHTPGDVAAFGVETADPRVVKLNNLKVMPEEALEAVRILNRVGGFRGWNGLPHLLPGINFVAGLMGETSRTFELNLSFLKRILEEGLLVRRINIRQVMPIPMTPMWSFGTKLVKRHKKLFRRFKETVRRVIDLPMLRRLVPTYTVVRGAYVEKVVGGGSYARQPASYPLLFYVPQRLSMRSRVDLVVIGHGFRSVVAVPYPVDINSMPLKTLEYLRGIGKNTARRIAAARPFKSVLEVKKLVGDRGLLASVGV